MARAEVVSWLRASRSPSRSVTSGCESEILLMPVTVAGPHRHCTGFRVPHSRRIVEGILPLPFLFSKRVGDERLEARAFTLVRSAIGAGASGLEAGI